MEKPVFCQTAEPLLSKCCTQYSGILVVPDSRCVVSQLTDPNIDLLFLECARGQDAICSVLFSFEKLQPSQKDVTALPEVTAAESSIKVIRAPPSSATAATWSESRPDPPETLRGAMTVSSPGRSGSPGRRRVSVLGLVGAAALALLVR